MESFFQKFPDILKYGIIGLGAIIAALAFFLLKKEQEQNRPRKNILTSIYIFMVFGIVLVVLGLFSPKNPIESPRSDLGYTVPIDSNKIIVRELPQTNTEGYVILKDISIFDLRGWKQVPAEMKDSRFSPANYINYLHIKKISIEDSMYAHYSTSGSGIDLRCITQNYKIYEQIENSSHSEEKNYGISIDISNIPLEQEFLVVIEATYWNGFQNITEETATTYTDNNVKGLDELDLIILLPYDKPFKSINRFVGEGNELLSYTGVERFSTDALNNRFIFWNIRDLRPNSHYSIKWSW